MQMEETNKRHWVIRIISVSLGILYFNFLRPNYEENKLTNWIRKIGMFHSIWDDWWRLNILPGTGVWPSGLWGHLFSEAALCGSNLVAVRICYLLLFREFQKSGMLINLPW